MGFFDLVRELRSGAPNVKKAAKAMNCLVWACLVGALWNFILPQTAPFKETDLPLPASYPYVALIGFSIIGALFLLSSRGIQKMEPWGKRAGQAAIILLFVEIILFSVLIMPEFAQFPSTGGPLKIVFYIFFAIVLAQFGLLAYFGVRYLGRLPSKDDLYSTVHYNPDQISRSISERMKQGVISHDVETKYKDSPFPFGITGTFLLLIAAPLLLIFVGQKYAGPEAIALLFPFVFLFIFLGLTIFNYSSSPFQKNRKLVATFTGGGSIFLFHGSWPFFRLIVYDDALEVRVMFHRFLIPYERMEDIPGKIGFFSTGMLIKSDLPDVPSSIRFSSFGMKKLVQIVSETRRAFEAASQIPKT
jgi:hypothetical protein